MSAQEVFPVWSHSQVQALVIVANQVFDLERKVRLGNAPQQFQRIITKMHEALELLGIEYADPTGEPFDATRADCEGHIAGTSTDDLVITEVIKPIVRERVNTSVRLLQRAVVIAESRRQEAT